jgi:hypothetical protein
MCNARNEIRWEFNLQQLTLLNAELRVYSSAVNSLILTCLYVYHIAILRFDGFSNLEIKLLSSMSPFGF